MLKRLESDEPAPQDTGAVPEVLPLSAPESNANSATAAEARLRRFRRRIAIGALSLALCLIVVAAGLAWQATRASLSLDLLRGRIESAVRARLPADAIVTIGSTAISYRRDQGIILRAR